MHISLRLSNFTVLSVFIVKCMLLAFNFGHKCTTNESNANHLKSIFNKVI